MIKIAEKPKNGSGCLGYLAKTATLVAITIAFLIVADFMTPSKGAIMSLGDYIVSLTELVSVAFLILILVGIYRTITR